MFTFLFIYNPASACPNGNISEFSACKIVDPFIITYVYDPLNRLTEANYSNNDYYHYTYDAVGNRETQSKSVLGFVTDDTYVYDDANRLTSVTAGGTTSSYVYNADGKRVTQTIGSTVTNDLWEEASSYGDVVYEYDNSGSTLASYVLGGTGLISQTRSSTTNYFLQDGQGSTRWLTSTTGNNLQPFCNWLDCTLN